MTPVEYFIHRLSPDLQQAFLADPNLKRQLSALLSSVKKEWPEIKLDSREVLAYFAAHFPTDANLSRMLLKWYAKDLYLCCACVKGNSLAINIFVDLYNPIIRGILSEWNLEFNQAKEFEQLLRVLLFFGEAEKAPLLQNYQGVGKLSNWLRVVTKRIVRRWLQQERRSSGIKLERLEEMIFAVDGDVEFSHIKQNYREAFRQCFRRTFEELTDREKVLLRYRYGDNLSLERIAAIYRVRHPTIHRWLESARQTLLFKTRDLLIQDLGIEAHEFSNVMALIQSRLDVTLSTFFGRKEYDKNTLQSDGKNG